MRTAHVNDIEIEYEVIGQGEPLLLIHGSNLATGLAPLAAALAVEAPSLQLVRYHRRGMAGSGGRGWPISVQQQAADALGLLDALLEPILTEVPGAQAFMAGMEPVMSLYAAGDMAGAASTTFAGLGGPGWRELVATAGPDALDLAVRDTELFYRAEAPSLTTWTLDRHAQPPYRARCCRCSGPRAGPFSRNAANSCISASPSARTPTSPARPTCCTSRRPS